MGLILSTKTFQNNTYTLNFNICKIRSDGCQFYWYTNHIKMKRLSLLYIFLLTATITFAQNRERIYGGYEMNARVVFISPFYELGNNGISAYGVGGGLGIFGGFFVGGYQQRGSWKNLSRAGDLEVKYRHGGLWLGHLTPLGKSKFSIIPSIYLARGKSNAKQNFPVAFVDGEEKFNILTPEIGIDYRFWKFATLMISGGYHFYSKKDHDDWPVGYGGFDLNEYYLKLNIRTGI